MKSIEINKNVASGKERIVVYKRPFYETCNEGGTTYYANGEPYITFDEPRCKGALFTNPDGDSVCCIVSDGSEDYGELVKELRRLFMKRPSFIDRLKVLCKGKRKERKTTR